MKFKLVEKTSMEILAELKRCEERNEYDECEMCNLADIVGSDGYEYDEDKVYIRAKDGLLVIPYTYTNDNENFTVYEILYPSSAYLAKDRLDDMNKLLKKKEDFLSALKYHIENPDVCDEEDIIGNILEDGTIERGYTYQGMVYKNPNAFKNRKGVCYVPEDDDVEYTYDDFFKMTNDHEVAELLFKSVDWQYPETLLEDWISTDEVHVCKKCDKSYLSYEVYECPHCKEPKDLD